MKKILLLPLSFLLLASCAFNNKFLQPTQLPTSLTSINLPTAKGEVVAKINPDNYQPTLFDTDGNELELDYTITSVVFKSNSGNKLNGWFLSPKGQKKDITLLHLHGNSGFLFSQIQAILPLVKQGFPVFMFDYSGYGFSSGEATRDNIIKDATSALSYLKSQSNFPNQKIVIYGQSLGGNLAAIISSAVEEEIAG
ncbi:MAG: alpha/beta fold hydrolase, partial [Flavobacteriaceae bacterium]|nr:alpha/beta fold hydrolase [Flavobacteriaceae bacterium]